jgi:hypothetical protein
MLPAALLAACAGAPRPAVPAAIAAAPGLALEMTIAATGVQIYECRAAAGQGGSPPRWIFVAPEARLFDAVGRQLGTHGAGPHWTLADGARVVGRVKARADAPNADAIPWLLLDAQPEGGPHRLSGITHIQRIHTRGGLAPSDGCTAARLGQQVRVPYTADYVFYGAGKAVASSAAATRDPDHLDPLIPTLSPRSIQ